MHFVNTFLKRTGEITKEWLAKYVDSLTNEFTDGFNNVFLDDHISFRVPSAKPYLDRFEKADVPYTVVRRVFLATGCDVYVLIPNNGLVVELAADSCEAHTESLSTVPWRKTYPSTDPLAAAQFCVKHLGANLKSGGTTNSSRVTFPPGETGLEFEIHFVQSGLPSGSGLSLAAYESYLTQLHGNVSLADGPDGNKFYDQFMDNHIGLTCDTIRPYMAQLQAAGVPYFTRKQNPTEGKGHIADLFVEVPGGIILELAHRGDDINGTGLTPWDLCEVP